jgi:hypothetical protein
MSGRSGTRKKGDTSRVPGGFIALPWSVVDSPAYRSLSANARSLLIDLARQHVRNNNGRLCCSRAYMAKRGWRSADVLQRAKSELLDAEMIFETVKGMRPNKASQYALTWYSLDPHPAYDPGVAAFRRGAYHERKIAPLILSGGTEGQSIVPSTGTGKRASVPSPGTVRAQKPAVSVPSDGHHLDNHLPAAQQAGNHPQPDLGWIRSAGRWQWHGSGKPTHPPPSQPASRRSPGARR